MKKARFDVQQEPVSYKVFDDVYYIHICLNGEYKTETDEEGQEINYYEYDFNEIVTDNIDIDDVIADPASYLNYVVKHVDPLEQLRADVDYLLLMIE